MKLTEKQKAKIRKEIEAEKRPRVLKFETEINKKKNEDKTIEEIIKTLLENGYKTHISCGAGTQFANASGNMIISWN